ncbi:MAG: xanthine dehydrogenase family protein molybdopterin-binding subunit [Nitrospinota bacterium]
MPGERYVGQRLPAIDSPVKATGGAEYLADISLSGMAYGKVLRSPHAHARIRSIDVSKARDLPGVLGVVSRENTPSVKWGIFLKDEQTFCQEKVRFVGDEVAAVVAESAEAAQEALSLVSVEYEPLPALLTPEEAMEDGAPAIHEEGKRNLASEFNVERGDVDAAFKSANAVFDETYDTHMAHQAYIEPTGVMGRWNEDGTVTVWGPLQSPFTVREYMLSPGLQLVEEKIQVVQTRSGGAFGGKLDVKLLLIAAFLSREARRPVQIVLTPEEDLATMRPRMPARFHIQSAFAKDGKLLGKKVDVTADNGAYSSFSPAIVSSMAVRTDSLYKTPNVRVDGRLAYTTTEPSGQFRGFGNLQASFCWESHLDTAAEGLGMDPAELRLRNFTEPGETTVHGWRISSCGIRECVEKATRSIGWKQKRRKSRSRNASANLRGVGLACTVHVTSNSSHAVHFRKGKDEAEGEVQIGADGRVRVLSGEAELGEGAATVMALVAAEELGVDYRGIEVPHVDTARHPYGLGTYASRATFMGGHATLLAAKSAKQQLLQRASKVLEADTSELTAEDGRVFVKGAPARSLSFGEVIEETGGDPVETQSLYVAAGDVPDPVTKYGHTASTYSFAAHAAEVVVDRETGEVTVERVACAHDLGRAINPLGAEGQIEGGAAQSIGFGLMEEIRKENGVVVNPNFEGYLILTSMDAPECEPIFVETIDPYGPFGGKGVAETAINPTAAAVANAVYNAVGARVRALPITPERVLAAMAGK